MRADLCRYDKRQQGSSGADGPGGSSQGGAAGEGGTSSGIGGFAGVGGAGGAGGSGSIANVPLDPSLLSKCTGTNPIVCALAAPNGNYDVTVEVGAANSAGASQVAAETRHYAGPAVPTAAGATHRFVHRECETREARRWSKRRCRCARSVDRRRVAKVARDRPEAGTELDHHFVAGDPPFAIGSPPTHRPARLTRPVGLKSSRCT